MYINCISIVYLLCFFPWKMYQPCHTYDVGHRLSLERAPGITENDINPPPGCSLVTTWHPFLLVGLVLACKSFAEKKRVKMVRISEVVATQIFFIFIFTCFLKVSILTSIFFKGVKTTNQGCTYFYIDSLAFADTFWQSHWEFLGKLKHTITFSQSFKKTLFPAVIQWFALEVSVLVVSLMTLWDWWMSHGNHLTSRLADRGIFL